MKWLLATEKVERKSFLALVGWEGFFYAKSYSGQNK